MSKTSSLLGVIVGILATLSANAQAQESRFPPLPEAVTSFGAVTHQDSLYVFGGHKGERHDYSAETVSSSFHRLKLSPGQEWERLPSTAPGQGLAIIGHGKFLYRIGGMAARNPAGAKQDLYSTALVQRFDLEKKQWQELPPLPSPRSSHDATVIGDKLYIAGGWDMLGATNKPVWHKNALMLDLAVPDAKWQEFSQPFQRRALAVTSLGSRLYCVGGMDSDNQPTLAVEIYDTVTGQWSKGPDLPKGKNKGFGCSAIAQGKWVYACAFQGDLLRLAAEATSWEVAAHLRQPRIAHRLVTAGPSNLIILGGEDGDEEKTPNLELLTPAVRAQTADQDASPVTAVLTPSR